MDVKGINNALNSTYITVDSVEATGNIKDKNMKDSKESINQNDSKDKEKENKDAIDKLNELLKKDNTHAEYSEYAKLGKTILKIVDDKTKKVVMEVPQEKVLDVIASILKNSGLLDEKA